MSEHSEKAVELFKRGYNCSQAVVGAFSDDLNLDFSTAMKISSSFGGGMGRLREVCGALTGSFIVAGLMFGYDDPSQTGLKSEHYSLIRELADKFRQLNGSIICKELLGAAPPVNEPYIRDKAYYKKRPCAELVRLSVEALERVIEEKMSKKG